MDFDAEAAKAQADGAFDEEIAPVTTPDGTSYPQSAEVFAHFGVEESYRKPPQDHALGLGPITVVPA